MSGKYEDQADRLCSAIKDLSIQIKDRILFRNANFSVNPGDAVLLSGPNGIGKSTLLKSILQLETAEKTIKGEHE